MIVTAKQINKFARKSLAGLMAVWLSGFLFLFCCSQMSAANAADEYCPLSKKGVNCDKGTKDNDTFGFFGINAYNGNECCSFLPVVFDKARKIERIDKTVAVPVVIAVATLKLRNTFASLPIIAAYTTPVLYRDKVFIANCVFRI